MKPPSATALENAECYDLYVKSLDEIEKRFMAVGGDGIRIAIFVYEIDSDGCGGRMASTEPAADAAKAVRILLERYDGAGVTS